MNWVSKKLIMKKLKNYFHIEDQRNVQVSIFGKKQVKCHNLRLKTDDINNQHAFIHVQFCKIGMIELSFDSTKISDEPINIKIDKVELVIKFNENRVQNLKKRKQLQQFDEAVACQNNYQTKSFFQRQLSFLKEIISQFCIAKFNLTITNVDMCLEYKFNNQSRYFGVQLGFVEVKQRLVNSVLKQAIQRAQIHIYVKDLGIYLGICAQDSTMVRQGNNRQMNRGIKEIKKKFLVQKQVINVFYNQLGKQVSIIIENILVECPKLFLREILNVVKYVDNFMSNRPILKPKQGEKIKINMEDEIVEISSGTICWWRYLKEKIMQRFNKKYKRNILTSNMLRQYLFCLLYRYTFGYHQKIQLIIAQYQAFQTSHSIIQYHVYILEKIHKIQSGNQDLQLKGILILFCRIQQNKNFQQTEKNKKIHKLTYKAIKNSQIYTNYQNACLFLKNYQSEIDKSFSLELKIKQIRLNIGQFSGSRDFWSEMQLFKPSVFAKNKFDLADAYYQELFLQNTIKKNKSDFSLCITSLNLCKTQTYLLQIEVQSVKLTDCLSQKYILKVKNLTMTSQKNNLPFKFDQPDKIDVKAALIYLQIQIKFFQRILLLMNLATKVQSSEQVQSSYLDWYINGKVPQDKIFYSYSNTTKKIDIYEIQVIIPVHQKDIHYSLQLKSLTAIAPASKPSSLNLQQISVTRISQQNVQTRPQTYNGIIQNEDCKLLQNSRPLSAVIENIKGKSVFNLILPFLLIQISCEDIYYLINIISEWKKLLSNQYIFTKPIVKKMRMPQSIRQSNMNFLLEMQESQKRQKWEQSVLMEGIDIILYAQSKSFHDDNEIDNEIISIHINRIQYSKIITYTSESIKFKIRDLLVQSCLGRARINPTKLMEVMKPSNKNLHRSPIQRQKNQAIKSGLLFYSDNKDYFFTIQNNVMIDFNRIRICQDTKIDVMPIYIIHSVQLFDNLMVIYNTASKLSSENLKEKTFSKISTGMSNISKLKLIQPHGQKEELIYINQFDKIEKINILLGKINLIIKHKDVPVLSFCFSKLLIQHKTDFYVQKYFIICEKISIVDISKTAGLYPIILTTTLQTQAVFTIYNSSILQETYQRSSLFTIKLFKPQIYFLKRKIKDVVNFLMKTLGSFKSNSSQLKNQKDQGKYGFCFSIEIINPVIILPRNSLSRQILTLNAKDFIIRNYPDKNISYTQESFNTSFESKSENFQNCNEAQNDPQQFKSFRKEQNHKKNTSDFIVYIYGNEVALIKDIMMVKIHKMQMNYNRSVFTLRIPENVHVSLNQFTFNQIIRLTQQNLGEIPTIFPDINSKSKSKQVSFQMIFIIVSIKINIQAALNMILKIHSLKGNLTILQNGSKITQLYIQQFNASHEQKMFIEPNIKQKDEADFQKFQEMFIEPNIKQKEKASVKKLNEQILQNEKIKQLQRENKRIQKRFFNTENQKQNNQKQTEQTKHYEDEEDVETKITNVGRVQKWISGMCGKCKNLCCCLCFKQNKQLNYKQKSREELITQNKLTKIQSQAKNKKIIKQNDDQKPNLKNIHIQSLAQVLDFTKKLSQKMMSQKRRLQHTIYLIFQAQPTNQKSLYLIAKQLTIAFEQKKCIQALQNFFYKPYAQPDKPEYFRTSTFNNYRPFKMIIELLRSTLEFIINPKKNEERLIVEVDTRYESGSLGDTKKGPGISQMNINLIFGLWFQRAKTQNLIRLSEYLTLQYSKKTVIPYHQLKQKIKGDEIFCIFPYQSQKQKQSLKFYLPLSIIKSLLQFNKKPKPQKSIQRRQSLLLTQMKSPTAIRQTSLQQKQRSQQQIKLVQKQLICISKVGYIQCIHLQVRNKTQNNLLSIKLKQVKYCGLKMINKFEELSIHKVTSSLTVDYSNLKIGQYEPFVEPWNFQIQSRQSIKKKIQSNSIKLVSVDESVDKIISDKYVNGLNINFSTELFHTFKQIQMQYSSPNDSKDSQNYVDITVKGNELYQQLFSNLIIPSNNVILEFKQFQTNKTFAFPEKLKKSFGRQFKIQNKPSKKIRKNYGKEKFNFSFERIFLYHSYFDHLRRKKQITYRTPYRLLNLTKHDMILCLFSPVNMYKWNQSFTEGCYYAPTREFYQYDYLVNFQIVKKQRSPLQALIGKGQFFQEEYQKSQLSKKEGSHSKEEGQKNQINKTKKYTSLRYLFGDYVNKTDMARVNNFSSKLVDKFFPFSNQENRFIDPSDLVFKIDNHFLSLVCVKTQYKQKQTKMNQAIQTLLFYDTFVVVTCPLTIYNKSTITFNLLINGSQRTILQPNKNIELSYFPLSQRLSDIKIEFQENILHTQFFFFRNQIGERIQYMEVDKMESVSIKSVKESQSTCLVYILPSLIVNNETDEEFKLSYGKKSFPVDKRSTSCLSDVFQKTKVTIQIFNQMFDKHQINFSGQVDIFFLKKMNQNPIIRDDLEQIQSNICWQNKKKDLFEECIYMVINLSESNTLDNIRQIYINYQYQLVNKTNSLLTLYQNIQQHPIITLRPNQKKYIYFYENIPRQFYLALQSGKQWLSTSRFLLDALPGKSFTLKISKSKDSLMSKHLRIDVSKKKYAQQIQVSECVEDDDYPYQIKNATQYTVKVKEKNQILIIKPRTKTPFSWSNLLQNNHQIEVQIEEESKIYSLNQKSQFQPIVLMADPNINAQKYKHKKPSILFKREECLVNYNDFRGIYIVVLDLVLNKLMIHSKQDQEQHLEIEMDTVIKMTVQTNKFELHLPDQGLLEIRPSTSNMDLWGQLLKYSLSRNIRDKIYFTIQSSKKSLIFFFHTSKDNDYEDTTNSKKQLIIPTINISLINSIPQEVILIHAGGIKYTQINKSSSAYQNSLNIETCEQILKIKKIKINNQMQDAVNPVVLSQIKKSNYPFLQIKTKRQQISSDNPSKKITHYKYIVFFLDEAEMIVEFTLFNQIMALKQEIEHMTNQYAVNLKPETAARSSRYQQQVHHEQIIKQMRQQSQQVYISYMQIKPIKMTISVTLSTKKGEELQTNIIGVVRLIPFGVQNAIIKIDSFVLYHIFHDSKQIVQSLRAYYQYAFRKQILFNAGSYDILIPIQLVKGLGVGMKNIFYDPFYELVKKKEIKAVTSTFCQGLLSLFIFLLTLLIKIVSILVKVVALLTFDRQFQTGRQMFRKQIFKSPMEGLVHGWRYFWKIFKSFFINLFEFPKKYAQKYVCIGGFIGLFLAFISIIPWVIKIVVTVYDFLYVIGLGFLNWGFYQQSAMKLRSRPIRTFPNAILKPYNFKDSQAYEIISRNQIEPIQSEQIYFAKVLEDTDNSSYLILSNYRIVFARSKYYSSHEIKISHIDNIEIKYQNQDSMVELLIKLRVPNYSKFLLMNWKDSNYSIRFVNLDILYCFVKQFNSIGQKQQPNLPPIQIPQNLKKKHPPMKDFNNVDVLNDILEQHLPRPIRMISTD